MGSYSFGLFHRKDGLVLTLMGAEATFEILNVMEYSSARGRMSVIVRAPNGSIRLLCKGADSKVLDILDSGIPKSLMDSTQSNLHLFATQVPFPFSVSSPLLMHCLQCHHCLSHVHWHPFACCSR